MARVTFPVEAVRARFPALRAGKTVFLDNAAGSQVPDGVVAAVAETLSRFNANRGGVHAPSVEVTQRRENVREATARFINAGDASGVVWGANATSLLTLLADSWRRRLGSGDEVIVTELDHHANVDTWKRTGATIRVWPVRMPCATLHVSDMPLTPRTKLVAMTAASNVLGTIPPVREAADAAHAAGALVCVDAVHASAHHAPDVAELGADMLVFSPYKVFGPHLGVLYLSERLMRELPHHGLEFLAPGDPITWEPGTQNHEAIAGFGAALDYLAQVPPWGDHELDLTRRLLDGLSARRATIYGLEGAAGRTATVAFNLGSEPAAQVAARLASAGVAVAAGHNYAYTLVMRVLGLEDRGGLVRASALHYNNAGDIDRLLEAL